MQENYLRWDSLGEFLAIAVSLEHLAEVTDNPRARVLGETLDRATGQLLDENKGPARKVGQIDNRGSHVYLALFWAQELARQSDDPELASAMADVAQQLSDHEGTINEELIAAQGHQVDIGGYYQPDPAKVDSVMRPSQTFNEIIATLA